MKLTGKCKGAFEKWYITIFLGLEWGEQGTEQHMRRQAFVSLFYEHPFSMQYGVYMDFFVEQKIFPCINAWARGEFWGINVFTVDENGVTTTEMADGTTPIKEVIKARALAIEKANEIYNES